MKVSFLSLLLISFLILTQSCTQNPKENLTVSITNLLNEQEGQFAIAFHNLTNGDTLFINADESFHAASTMKTPVMLELFKQAQEGKFEMTDSILIKDEFFSIVDSSVFKMDVNVDSENRLYGKIGQKATIKELMYEMITMSSNLATNILIDLVDAKSVTKTMRDIGAQNINVLRGVEDLKAFDKGMSNTTTARDLAIIYEKIAKKDVVSAESCDSMINILTAQHFNDMIPMHLPEDVTVAHKTGSITGVHHDSGIIYLPDGSTYVLVLLSKELEDFDKGTETLAQASKHIYEFVQNDY